jgi:hypothetical protein
MSDCRGRIVPDPDALAAGDVYSSPMQNMLWLLELLWLVLVLNALVMALPKQGELLRLGPVKGEITASHLSDFPFAFEEGDCSPLIPSISESKSPSLTNCIPSCRRGKEG